MGGVWSGQRSSKKPVVEGQLAVDTADLRRLNLLVPGITDRIGSLHWRRDGEQEPLSSVSYTLSVGNGSGTFRLLYKQGPDGERLDYPVGLVSTSCRLGGVRWWFVCPLSVNGVACGRRVRKLYLRGKYFGCRHCHGLAYTSSQESDSRVYALLHGGLDPGLFGDARGMSGTQLGLALKALMLEERQLDRLDRRLARGRRGRRAKGDADGS
ncbi:MAG TPA: hypothetical protein VKE74_13930 [Gemmataceae bacterium]|nr:hypothetical protein [Gemmataceae bacterium]